MYKIKNINIYIYTNVDVSKCKEEWIYNMWQQLNLSTRVAQIATRWKKLEG